MDDSRKASLQIIKNILENKDFSGLNNFFLPKKEDAAFVTMLIMSTLRNLVYIRKTLKSYMRKKLSSQNNICQYALILGTTELLYMQTPNYAIINSYVDIVKRETNSFIAGFVNAVLRQISKNKLEIIKNDTKEFFPQNFRTLLRKSYSSKTIIEIEKIAKKEPLLDITCINTDSAEKLQGKLLPLGTIRLSTKGKISLLADYQKGTWWVQDFSSSLAVKMLKDIQNKKVLELCSAPGGKTAQLLSLGAQVTCVDISKERLQTLSENLNRLNLKPEKIICADGVEFLKQNTEKYDIVLLDAPCSATGTLRRHPEIVHTKTIDDIIKLATLQKDFLTHIDSALKNNGIILYCTCSLCKDEGENQINHFLNNHKNYKIIPLNDRVPHELSPIVTKEGFLRILPHHLASFGGADGFFIACLQKEG